MQEDMKAFFDLSWPDERFSFDRKRKKPNNSELINTIKKMNNY